MPEDRWPSIPPSVWPSRCGSSQRLTSEAGTCQAFLLRGCDVSGLQDMYDIGLHPDFSNSCFVFSCFFAFSWGISWDDSFTAIYSCVSPSDRSCESHPDGRYKWHCGLKWYRLCIRTVPCRSTGLGFPQCWHVEHTQSSLYLGILFCARI